MVLDAFADGGGVIDVRFKAIEILDRIDRKLTPQSYGLAEALLAEPDHEMVSYVAVTLDQRVRWLYGFYDTEEFNSAPETTFEDAKHVIQLAKGVITRMIEAGSLSTQART